MTPSPIDRRLIDLRLLGTPEQAEELAFLEEYADWKATGQVKALAHKRAREKVRQFNNTQRLLGYNPKKL